MIKIALVNKKNGSPAINWKGVAGAYASIVLVMSLTFLAIHFCFKAILGYTPFGSTGWVMLGLAGGVILPSLMLGVWVRTALATPAASLTELDPTGT